MGNRKLQWSTATFLFWVAASHSAYAACEQRIIEAFTLTQSNGFEVEANFYSQHYFLVGGDAQSYSPRQQKVSGKISNGKLTGDHLHFLVTWKNGTVGIYDADIDSSGRLINGTTFDREHPSSKATWTTNVKMKCCVARPGAPCVPGR
jgi:hypothetical protein